MNSDTGRKIMAVAWPAFVAACVLELLVFAMVDPHELHWLGQPFAWSRQAIYTAGFFVFWLAAAIASGLTALLCVPAPEVNAQGLREP
jgi:hypothetical protein